MKKNRIKVAFIIATLSMGGAEKQLVYTLNELSKNPNIEPHLFLFKNQTKLLHQVDNNIPITIGNISNIMDLVAWTKLIKSILKFQPNIIHSNLFNGNLFARLLKIFNRKTKILNHIHGLGERYSFGRRVIDRLTLPLVDHIIVVSKKSKVIRQERDRVPSDKISVLYNSVDFNKISNVSINSNILCQRPIILGTASRLIKLKNIEAAIYLTKSLNDIGIGTILKIAGIGPELKKLQNYAQSLEIIDKIHFLGFVDDTESYFSSLSAFVICSTTEDLPLSIIEALSVGRPVIATPVGGIPEMLEDTFHILEEDFYKKTFAIKIANFMKSIDTVNVIFTNQEAAKRKFDRPKNTAQLIKVYDKLMSTY